MCGPWASTTPARVGTNFETILTPANVPKLRKVREFMVDEKIDVTPLVVADKLYVFTMTNTAYIFDVNTGAELAKRPLAAPFDPFGKPNANSLNTERNTMLWILDANTLADKKPPVLIAGN